MQAQTLHYTLLSRLREVMFADACAFVLLAASSVALIGWGFDIAFMKSVFLPGDVLKVPNAILFVLIGISLTLLKHVRRSSFLKRIFWGLCTCVTLLGLCIQVEYITGLCFGLDTVIQPHQSPMNVMLMSPVSAMNFSLLGCAMFLMCIPRAVRVAQWFIIPVLLVGFLVLVGYLYATIMHFGVLRYSPMTPITGFLFILSGAGLFFRFPDEGYARQLIGKTTGGWVFRVLFPFVLLYPVFIGWLQLNGEFAGYFDSSFRIACMMVFLGFVMSLVLWFVARTLDSINQAHRQVELTLKESEAHLRVAADSALRKSEEKYRLLTENSSFGVASHELLYDEAGKPIDYVFLSANPAFEQQTNLKVKDVVGRRVSEVLPGIEHSRFIEIYGKVVATGEPAYFEQYAEPLGRHYAVSAYRIGDREFAVVFTDISDRKIAEEEQRQREAFLKLLLETVPIPVFYKGIDGRYVFVNKAFETLFWRSKDEIIGKNAFDICPSNLAEIYTEDDRKLFKEAQTSAYYSQVEDTMGVMHEVIFQKASMTDPKGNVVGLIGAILNITDQKRMEEELRDVRKQLDDISARPSRSSRKKDR